MGKLGNIKNSTLILIALISACTCMEIAGTGAGALWTLVVLWTFLGDW